VQVDIPALVRDLPMRPLDPDDVTPSTPEARALKEHWLAAAHQRGGIDAAGWDIARGLDDVNRKAVYAVPSYYAKLYGIDRAFNWSGMASLIAPSFVAGMEDSHNAAQLLTRAQHALEQVPLVGESLAQVPAYYAERSTRLEKRLMIMQREIFEDQAVMHEAYLGDGMRGIKELHRTGLIDDHARDAWQVIDAARTTPNPEWIAAANLALLRREQLQLVEDDYDLIRHAASGRLATFGMANVGRNAIPGVEPLSRYKPVRIAKRFGLLLTASDLSKRNVRWDYIVNRVFPRWQELATKQPALVSRMINTDTATRIAREGLRLLR
jgi:hypothetical protein